MRATGSIILVNTLGAIFRPDKRTVAGDLDLDLYSQKAAISRINGDMPGAILQIEGESSSKVQSQVDLGNCQHSKQE